MKRWYNILVTYFVHYEIGVLLKLNKKLSEHVKYDGLAILKKVIYIK